MPHPKSDSPSIISLSAIFLLSAATLLFEINLTRLFSVSQFYHFAFMIVSLALLGYGASGTTLAIFPKWGRQNPNLSLRNLAVAVSISILGAYLLTNWLPFDSFSIAWDRRQIIILAAHYTALAVPFLFSGITVGLFLSIYPGDAGKTYAVNLTGSSLGCLLALFVPTYFGAEGSVTISSGIAAAAALMLFFQTAKRNILQPQNLIFGLLSITLLGFNLFDLGMRITGQTSFPIMDLYVSPYKSISYALQYPGAEHLSQNWNEFSRVDVFRSPGVRSLPGLSYRYPSTPPQELGLTIDGDNLTPIVLSGEEMSFTGYMPAAIAYLLNPQAKVLILEPRGGLDLLVAIEGGAQSITAVEPNRLIIAEARHIYDQPQIKTVIDTGRSYLRRSQDAYDVIQISLTETYHPIQSGAYSLGEDYRYTVQAFQDALARLEPGGILVITRWLQMPPSEFLRAFAVAVTALEKTGVQPGNHLIALRSFNIGLILVKNTPFTSDEGETVRTFARKLSFDLVYAPDIQPLEANQYNVLQEPLYYQAFNDLLSADPRAEWYAQYPYDISPPVDSRPFFGHFFKWSQANQVLAEFGKTWQPFGGAGYFVLLALLAMVLVIVSILILLPAILLRSKWRKGDIPRRMPWIMAVYFGFIGLGYMLVEIPLIQHFILFLGHPAYAVTGVIFSLLLFSGIGSLYAHRLPHRATLTVLVVFSLLTPLLLPLLFRINLGLPLSLRLVVSTLSLAPLGFLMGIPFARGLNSIPARLVPWAWGVNGASSVVSSVLAALLAISFGFNWVLIAGALCYAGALIAVPHLKATIQY
ncbi:MAG: hypothetical protein MUO76_20795 [Anaerolineaceae bacterium]|nr:hypothetical protein [Anaerolineaceae bacterium]